LRNTADRPAHPSERVVVSLTSFPGRLERINDTIHSIANQSRKVDRILLSIPWEVKRVKVPAELPPIVKELEEEFKGILKIKRTEDYGPSTKLLGALLDEKDPETIIITVDDDTIYHRDMVLSLVDTIHRIPNVAPCFVCEIWPWWFPFKPIYQLWEGECRGWANAFAATAFRVGYFGEGEGEGRPIFDYSEAPKGCRLHDDVWITGNMYRRGIRPYVVKPGFFSIVGEKGHTNLSINSVKSGEKEYRDPCVRYFNYFQ
ncbi:hypothetical protein HK102_007035, partial [Quaeritorhiza haematococci]